MVVAGDGGDPGAAQLAARLGWPLLAEPTSGARHGSAAIGTGALLLASAAFRDAHVPDLVVVSGKLGLSRSVQALLGAAPQVRFDPHGRWWDPVRGTELLVPARVDAWLAGLVDELPVGPVPWLAAWRDADAAARAAVDAALDADDAPSEPLVARDLVGALPRDALLVAASSRPIRDLDAYAVPRPLATVGNRGASGIDGFVSTALGAALAWDGPVAALAGDLSVLHDANGLTLGPGEVVPRWLWSW